MTTRLRAAIARTLFLRAASRMPIQVLLPGEVLGGRGQPVMQILRPEALFTRLGQAGLIGFGEAYMAGDWDSEDLPALLTVFASQVGSLIPAPLQRMRRFAVHGQPLETDGDMAGARRNAGRHYDLSNELFALFLDETMTYSSALFADRAGEDLVTAQHRKIDRLLDQAGVGPDRTLLEIGTGWGELALRAGRRGALVRTLTLSVEQREAAMRRIAEAGLADRVCVELCDYRQARGQHDAIVSVEMIEAVGARYWPVYFRALRGLLAPGGRVGLQAITMPHDRLLATRDTHTWIQKYVFPGGLIPSTRVICENAAAAGLEVDDRYAFGPHYAETLRRWREGFEAAADDVAELGFDRTFRRMWEFYLAYSEAGFRSGYLDVQQFTLISGGAR